MSNCHFETANGDNRCTSVDVSNGLGIVDKEEIDSGVLMIMAEPACALSSGWLVAYVILSQFLVSS
jgi:hypothetical protein